MIVNKKFKNGVFTMLFDNPDLLRNLYCALGGVSLPPDVPVVINTLENVLFMDFNNDISFEIGGKLVVLVEHQSTINPNMALRLLIYFSRVIEKTIKGGSLYSRKRLSIPRPEFYVLYNGKDPFPDTAVLRLSELFENPQGLGLPVARPLLELEVKVININEGRNSELVNRCKELAEYSFFTGRVRKFWKESGDLEEAVRSAVKYCRKHGIMKQFLEIHGSEVLNMLMTEWNTEDAIAYAREEGWEDGRKEGREEGREEGKTKEKLLIARNLLAKGSTREFVQEITGLEFDVIQGLEG